MPSTIPSITLLAPRDGAEAVPGLLTSVEVLVELLTVFACDATVGTGAELSGVISSVSWGGLAMVDSLDAALFTTATS
jgi:hypothetical protein